MELAIRLGQHVTVVDLAVVGGQHGTADATTVLPGEPHHHVDRLVRRWKDDVEGFVRWRDSAGIELRKPDDRRSEEHTSELQSLMRISYAVFCLKKNKKQKKKQ